MAWQKGKINTYLRVQLEDTYIRVYCIAKFLNARTTQTQYY